MEEKFSFQLNEKALVVDLEDLDQRIKLTTMLTVFLMNLILGQSPQERK